MAPNADELAKDIGIFDRLLVVAKAELGADAPLVKEAETLRVRIRAALTAPVEAEPVWFVVDQNGLCLVPDEHVEAVRALFNGPDIEVNGRKLKKAVKVYASPPPSDPAMVVVPREPGADALPLPDAFVTCTSAAPDYFVTIKTTTLKEAQNWHDAVLDLAQRGRG